MTATWHSLLETIFTSGVSDVRTISVTLLTEKAGSQSYLFALATCQTWHGLNYRTIEYDFKALWLTSGRVVTWPPLDLLGRSPPVGGAVLQVTKLRLPWKLGPGPWKYTKQTTDGTSGWRSTRNGFEMAAVVLANINVPVLNQNWNDAGNIGSGNGLVPQGTKPLPQPRLPASFPSQFSDGILWHVYTLFRFRFGRWNIVICWRGVYMFHWYLRMKQIGICTCCYISSGSRWKVVISHIKNSNSFSFDDVLNDLRTWICNRCILGTHLNIYNDRKHQWWDPFPGLYDPLRS